MPDFRENYPVILAVLVELLVAALLLSTPGMIMSEGVNVVDARNDISTNTGIFVRTKLDFGSQEHLNAFPRQLGEWSAAGDYPTKNLPERLNAKTMIFRPYSMAGLYTSVDFLAMLSENVSAFHPPEICYAVQGWTIDDSTLISLPVENATWVSGSLFRTGDEQKGVSLPIRKLLISKEVNNQTYKQIVLYFYIKESKVAVDKSITMLRYSIYYGTMGVVNETEALDILKDFAAETVPHIFMLEKPEQPIGVLIVQHWGFGGAMLEATMMMAPIGFIAYAPLTRWLRKRFGR